MSSSDQVPSIRWPPEFAPDQCGVHVSNELEMTVPAADVWSWLVHARLWPSYYSNAHNVVFVTDTESPILKENTRFTWRTFDVNLQSQVREYVENERIAWDARGALGLSVYHAWLIVPRPNGGCWVRTEETQKGVLARLGNTFLPNRMQTQHQRWLERLEEMAKQGPPPTEKPST